MRVTLLAVLLTVLVAVVMGYGRISHIRRIRWASGAVIEFFRGTSAVVQLFWAYFVLPLLPGGPQLSPLMVALVVLGLNGGCYAAEIVRGAIRAVPRGQGDAALALGLSPLRRQRAVILPQALPMMLPGFGNVAVDLMKASAVVGFVNLKDLGYWADQTRVVTGESVTTFAVALLMYFVFALLLAGFSRLLEWLTPLRRIQRLIRRDLGMPAEEQARASLAEAPELIGRIGDDILRSRE